MAKKSNTSNTITAPKYCPGSVVDLGHKYGEQMPNRIKIDAVYRKENSNSWMYWVFSEMHNNYTYMSEGMINHRLVDGAIIDDMPAEYKKRYSKGYRFCGHYPNFIAQDKAIKMRDEKEIASVILHPAIDDNGNEIYDYYGLWIKYGVVVYDNGNIWNNGMQPRQSKSIIIK
jgi:hypothetical protein